MRTHCPLKLLKNRTLTGGVLIFLKQLSKILQVCLRWRKCSSQTRLKFILTLRPAGCPEFLNSTLSVKK